MKHASRAAALVASAAIGAALALGAFIATEGTSDSPTPATRTIVEGGRKRPDHRRGRHPHRRTVYRSAPAHVR
jgi:hypothetical protein